MKPTTAEIFQRVPAKLGEGPCWHAARRSLWWVDILGRKYFEARLDGSPAREVASEQMIGAVVVERGGGMLAALQDGIYRVNPDSGAAALFVRPPAHDVKRFRFNDGKVDPRGRFWAGTTALDDTRGQSRLFRTDSDGKIAVMREGVSISNGLAWTPDARKLFYIDSPTRTVQEFQFDEERGTIGEPRVVITLGDADGWPDGCAMDAEGFLWVAHWGASKVTRWDASAGKLISIVHVPVRNVTSCAFGGPRLDRLFITTAKDDENAAPEPEAGFVFTVDPGTRGQPVSLFGENGRG